MEYYSNLQYNKKCFQLLGFHIIFITLMIGKVTSHMSWAIEHTITIIAAANTDFVRTMSHNNNLLQTGLCVRPWLFVDVSLLCSLSRFWCTFYAFRPLSIIIWCTWCLICCNFTSELLQLRDKQLLLKPSHFCQLTAMISLVSSCTLDSFCIARVRCLCRRYVFLPLGTFWATSVTAVLLSGDRSIQEASYYRCYPLGL